MTKFKDLGENMKNYWALLGAKVIEFFDKTQYLTKSFPNRSPTKKVFIKIL